MKRLLLLLCASPLFAQDFPALQTARRALAEGIPQVAMVKLNAILRTKDLGMDQRTAAQRLLAEAQLAAGQSEAALATLQQIPESSDPALILLRANVEVSVGQWNSALRRYQELREYPDAPLAAVIGEAECLQAIGRTTEAVSTLRSVAEGKAMPPAVHLRLASLYVELDRPTDARRALSEAIPSTLADERWQKHIEARILLLEKDDQGALAILEPLLADRTGLSGNLVAAATLALAEARLISGGPDAAANTLVTFILQYPDSPQIELIFRRLDQIYALDPNPPESALHSFFTKLPPKASALGQFYVTRMQLRTKRFGRAQTSLGTFLSKFPNHELIPYAHAMQADLALEAKDLPLAEKAFDEAARTAKSPELRAEMSLRAALINLQQGKFVQAATRLKEAEAYPRLRQSAAYNAALGWVMQQDYHRFRQELASFATQFPNPVLTGQLRLEEGLVQARNGHAEASETLHAFLKDFPDHPRKSEAQVAVAELAFLNNKTEEATALLATAKEGTPTAETAERAEYLAIFLADKKRPAAPEEVIRLARNFIARYPASPLISEVRMKLGQVYFAEEDYLKAQEQFEGLAAADPKGPYSEMALFLAGQCGMKLINTDALNHAIELFDKVAERKGALEAKARLQQAIIQNKLGAEDDAVKIYDTILGATTPIEPEIRFAALIGKGDNLISLAKKYGTSTPAMRERSLNDAAQAYSGVLSIPDAGPTWRNQAAYKRGKVLQQLGRTDDAKSVFYDVLAQNTPESRETFWYAKAGFDLAALLEAGQNWKNAVAVYAKMAQVPGPHVSQAQQRIKTLRLEHFLWE